MYTEGFEDLEEADKSSRRAYVSHVSQEDSEWLLRENERLKAALEKEQFFNKLLDQEIQELKGNQGQQEPYYSSYWYGNRGVSKGAFYFLLFIALSMAAYIGYGIYYDKQFDYLKEITPKELTTTGESTPAFTTPSGNNESKTSGEAQPGNDAGINNSTETEETVAALPPSSTPVKDSVPNIVFNKKAEAKQQAPATPVRAQEEQKEMDIEQASGEFPAEPVDTRPVIARYRITSKANFYSSPDENKMRSAFISHGNDKIVGALEEKNGFIYVVYTNDLGYTSKGWLSVKDLTKVE